MKQTEEDKIFAARFATELQPYVDRDLAAGLSMKAIAEKLGVTAWGLQKQLNGGTPSVRTVALAYAAYRVSVNYGNVEVQKALRKGRRTNKFSEQQLMLPFKITAPVQVQNLQVKMTPKSTRNYQLQVSFGCLRRVR